MSTPPRHRLLIVGTGSIGERHLRCFLSTGRVEASICETHPALRQALAARYPLQAVYADLDAALRDRHDAVVIATPAHTHVAIARQCAAAGLHLLIEKPLTVSMAGVDALCQEVRRRELIAAVAYVWRGHPLLTQLRAWIKDRRWGRPLELTLVTGQHFPTYRPAYRDIYYNDRATGGGAILDALPHAINAGEWIAGPITHVFAHAAHVALPGVEVEDTVHVTARHGDVLASYCMNQHQPANETTLTVVCERGIVRLENHRGRIRWMQRPDGAWESLTVEPPDRDTPFAVQAKAFLDALDGRGVPLCSLAEGIATQRTILEALVCAEAPPWRTVAQPTHAAPQKVDSAVPVPASAGTEPAA